MRFSGRLAILSCRTKTAGATQMPTWFWLVVVIGLLALVAYLAFLLGRSAAMRHEASPAPGGPPSSSADVQRRGPSSPGVAPPPVLAGTRGDAPQPSHRAAAPPASAGGGVAQASLTPSRQTAAAPAAPAGPQPSVDRSGAAVAPKRSAAPPPAQAAWSTGHEKTDRGTKS